MAEDAVDYTECPFVNSRGLITAIREFISENKPKWKIIYDSCIWPGLTIIERKNV